MRARVAGALAAALAVALPVTAGAGTALAAGGWTQAVRSMPGLRIPRLIVTADDPSVAPGFIFVTPRTIYPGRTGPTIFDRYGHVVWFHRQSKNLSAQNLRPQIYQGKPVLTWSLRPPLAPEGATLAGGPRRSYDVIADSSYHIIKRVRAQGRGVVTDSHDFVITPQDTALVLGGRYRRERLSRYGGPAHSGVIDNLVQEIDLKTGKMIFNWSARHHIPLSESTLKPPSRDPWDAFHLNSVSLDSDGNLLISARHTSTIYKVDRHSGRIIWRLGGRDSSFKLARGASFYYQHDALRQPDGTITLFDNGATDLDKSHAHSSQAKRLRLDMKSKTATLVSSFRPPAGAGLATSQGNAELLDGGNVFVGWGISPWLSEYAPDGRLLFSAHFTSIWHHSYRAFKAQWEGHPSRPPAVSAKVRNGRVVAYVTWNGATDVAQWRLLGGPSADALSPLVTQPRVDFETQLIAQATPAFVQAEALDLAGDVIGRSAVKGV